MTVTNVWNGAVVLGPGVWVVEENLLTALAGFLIISWACGTDLDVVLVLSEEDLGFPTQSVVP